ncbi:hypothetical protein [Prosthecobacter sp.]|uniref:hypothetical protein n=1 Tax=Prosthecobacter sp. TaxID=1965333 RepID=UPI0037845655
MKHILTLIIGLLLFSPTAHAGWFSLKPDPLLVMQIKIDGLENKLAAQNQSLNRWQIATGSLAVGCAFLLILGTALGSKTRKHFYDTFTRRMGGSTPSPASLNGRKSHMAQATEENVHATLAS